MAGYRTLLIFAITLWASAQGPRPVSLAEAGARAGADFRPKLLGEPVTVQGVVSGPPLAAADGVYLPLADASAGPHGLMLVFSGDNAAAQPAAADMRSGLRIEADGLVSLHAGQAVVKPTAIRILGSQAAPQPAMLKPQEAASLDQLGRLALIEGTVAEYREASSGDLLEFEGAAQPLRIFLPLVRRGGEKPLSVFSRGDRIRVRGFVSQFCLSPPFNRSFQLLVANAKDVELLEGHSSISPQLVPATVLLVLLGILGTWFFQQRAVRQNRMVQRMLDISEDLYTVNSAREVADVLRVRLLDLIPAETIEVFHYDPERKYVERVPDSQSSAPHAFHVDEGATAMERALGFCLRNRALLKWADTSTAALLKDNRSPGRSLMAVPMRSRDEAHGALLISAPPGTRLLPEALFPALQHLANDAGQYFDHLEQSSLKEQIHRSEKLAVAGQLIHGILTEINAPLEKIRHLSSAVAQPQNEAIRAQVEKATEIVGRIVSVARAEQMDARPVELHVLFEKVRASFLDQEEAGKIDLALNLSPEPIHVLGSQMQLEKVFENLLAHARAAAGHSLDRFLQVGVNRIGRSAMIEIEFSGPFAEGEGPDFNAAALGLAVSRGLMQSHGGDIRFVTLRSGRFRYEAELPSLSAGTGEDHSGAAGAASPLGEITALLVEPDPQSQRRLLAIFGELNHRLVPVVNIEEAADLAEKLRFDLVLSSTRPEGGTWAELFHRVHHRTPHFAVLTESAGDEDASNNLIDGRSASILRKPVDEKDIAALLERLTR